MSFSIGSRGMSLIVALSLTLAVQVGAAEQEPIGCIAPLEGSPPQCMLSFWGYVTDIDGTPLNGALVTDGTQSDRTDADGYYELPELQEGTYNLKSLPPRRPECVVVRSERFSWIDAVRNGGERVDFVLPCELA